jgi:hypothetical protein
MDTSIQLPQLGALERWRAELRAGKRGDPNRPFSWVLDDLWKAACKETVALELERAGDFAGARQYLDWAAMCLLGHDVDPGTPRGRQLLSRLVREAQWT